MNIKLAAGRIPSMKIHKQLLKQKSLKFGSSVDTIDDRNN